MTVAPSTLVGLQDRMVANLGTVNLGIVGDAEHVASGGYHIGAKTLRANGMSNDYSLEFAKDRADTSDRACAIDIGSTPAKLMEIGNRIKRALENKDPRVYNKVRAVNAPFDGDSIDRRYDTEDPTVDTDSNCQASDDRDHVHVEFYRTVVLDQAVMDGFYDVIAGIPPMEEFTMDAEAKAAFAALQTSIDKQTATLESFLAWGDKARPNGFEDIGSKLDAVQTAQSALVAEVAAIKAKVGA